MTILSLPAIEAFGTPWASLVVDDRAAHVEASRCVAILSAGVGRGHQTAAEAQRDELLEAVSASSLILGLVRPHSRELSPGESDAGAALSPSISAT